LRPSTAALNAAPSPRAPRRPERRRFTSASISSTSPSASKKSFGFEFPKDASFRVLTLPPYREITASDLHAFVVAVCRDVGVPIPPSSWTRVKLALAQTVGESPRRVHPDTLIVRDLGFSG
jgi:hypothetical protein